ncbi:YbaK/EbsC family protein [Anaeromyxobacter oryzisoli]|uniref:YbaK/EbsC family protein n=1 Tax=Anaeromyxobacter oryzisoli TaxID=2925408 RepID=UPI001F55F80C|nr:YbaK/EbsC family protein [Anaeromyxobacter sp. SG63]
MALKPSAQRVQDALAARGFDLVVQELSESARTAAEAAAALGCAVEQIAKSMVFAARPSGRAVLVVASGGHRVDVARVGALVHEAVEKPDAAFVRERTGFAIGGVPPVGHATPLVTLIDEDLLRLDALWAAAGHPHAVFRLTPAQLVALTGGTVAKVA